MEDRELTKAESKEIVSQDTVMSPQELGESIISVFKRSVRQAGNLSEEEYNLFHRSGENAIKMWLLDLIARIPN